MRLPDAPLHSLSRLPDSDSRNPPLFFRSIFISDLHLGTRDCKAEAILDFLKQTHSDYLYLVGDIVDGWQLKKHWHWPQKHNDVIQKIMKRARKGTQVFYIPGNHDEAARDYDGFNFGDVLVTNKVIHTTAKGERLLVLHGDQFDAVMGYAKWLAYLGDTAYSFALWLNHWLNLIRRKLGFRYWSLSAYLKHLVKGAVEYISSYETFIAEEARRNNVDGVVCGHIHYAEKRDLNGIAYYNDGDWIESCTALVENEDGEISIIHWMEERDALLAEATVEAEPLRLAAAS